MSSPPVCARALFRVRFDETFFGAPPLPGAFFAGAGFPGAFFGAGFFFLAAAYVPRCFVDCFAAGLLAARFAGGMGVLLVRFVRRTLAI
jgi:hypothetical protein